MYKIKTYNKISEKGLQRFSSNKYQVGENLSSADAIVLRSHKLHDTNIDNSVLAVARAGAGVNNVPIETYTKKGIVVFNTPGANANAVKELVIAGMLLSSRGILAGREYVNTLGHIQDAGKMSALLEKQKKHYAGSELAGKSLGIVGLGAIGSMVANVALSLGMEVKGFDPALSVDAAWRLPSEVQRMESLQALLGEVDYLSLHVPAIAATKHMINEDSLKLMRSDAVILNFARDAIVNPHAIVKALDKGELRQYVCDFPEPCLISHAKVVALPHIGASTAEAEENCAIMAANQLKEYLENGNVVNSVNFPHAKMGRNGVPYRVTFANDNVSGVLGEVLSIFATNKLNVVDMMNKSRNNLAYNILDFDEKPSDSVIEQLQKVEHVTAVRLLS